MITKIMKSFLKKNQDENTSIVLHNTMLTMLIKGGAVIVAFLTTPAYMIYFSDNEILGVWFTILSVLVWILYFDMGIGNGLRNGLVYAITKKDTEKMRGYISSAYIFLSFLGGVLLVLVVLVGRRIDWNSVFNISEEIISKSVLSSTIIVLMAAIIVQFVLRLITSILYAMQKSFLPSLLSLCTNVFLLIAVTYLNKINQTGDTLKLAWIYFIAINLPLAVATIFTFSTQLKSSIPRIKAFDMRLAKSILKVGGTFLWLQLMALILDTTNNYLITTLVGNLAVVEYQIYYRVFSVSGSMVALLSASIWSTVTKAKAEKNILWLKNAYNRFMILGGVLSLINFLIIAVLQIIFDVWLGTRTIAVNYAIATLFAISGSLLIMRTILATFSNGLCEVRVQVIYLTLGAAINIPLAHFFVQITHSYSAIIIANILSMIPYCIAQPIAFKKISKQQSVNSRKTMIR